MGRIYYLGFVVAVGGVTVNAHLLLGLQTVSFYLHQHLFVGYIAIQVVIYQRRESTR